MFPVGIGGVVATHRDPDLVVEHAGAPLLPPFPEEELTSDALAAFAARHALYLTRNDHYMRGMPDPDLDEAADILPGAVGAAAGAAGV
jgi:hypothetical protein